jgi:hypothetical protein
MQSLIRKVIVMMVRGHITTTDLSNEEEKTDRLGTYLCIVQRVQAIDSFAVVVGMKPIG